MQFRHDRRRRCFSDDSAAKPTPPAGSETGQPGKSTNYDTEAAQLARMRAVCSLVPARLLTIGLTVGACLMLVGTCLSLHLGCPTMASVLPADELTFLRLDAPRSVGHWLASTLMAAAGVLAMFIYSLRRHRVDDYHGRYRVWIWVFAACLVASLAETTGLGRLARAACRPMAEWLSLRVDVLWPATFGLVGAAIGVRLLFEMRRSRWSVAGLTASALGFLVGAAASSGWAVRWTGAGEPLLARGSWLTGYVFVLTTFLLYARHVQLEVAGAIAAPVKPRRVKSRQPSNGEPEPKPSRASAKPALVLRTDLESDDASTGVADPRSQSAADAPAVGPTDLAENTSRKSKKRLSKAERRQLRREARAVRMAS